MGASESSQQQQEQQQQQQQIGEEDEEEEVHLQAESEEDQERGFHGHPTPDPAAAANPNPNPAAARTRGSGMTNSDPFTQVPPAAAAAASGGILMNTLTAFVPEEHVNRLVAYMAIFGALFVIIGLVGLIFPLIFALAVEQVMGTLMVIGGIFSVVQYGIMYDVPGNTSFLLLGFLHLAFGLWMLIRPVEAGIMLMFVLSGWLLGHGLLKSLMACQVRNISSWPFVFVSGILSIVLAFFILLLAPRYGVVLLGLIFGADIFVSGLSMMILAATTYSWRRKQQVNPASVREPLLSAA